MKDLKNKEFKMINFPNILSGVFVKLRKMQVSDAKNIFEWRSSKSGKFMRHPENYSEELQREWIIKRPDDEGNYIITSVDNNEDVGTISIYDINTTDKVCNVGRLLLAEKHLKTSVPYGLEALLLAYDYVFNTMKFHKITGDILESNTDMVKLQKFLGMEIEGKLMNHTNINGQYHSIFILSLFQESFLDYSKKIKLLLRSFEERPFRD